MDGISKLEEAFKEMGIDEEVVSSDILPSKCMMCLNNTICNPLISFLTLHKIGIKLQIDKCPYFRSIAGD